MNIPNIVSLFRLFLAPVFAYLIVANQITIAIMLVILAGISDWLDGFLARKMNQITSTGQLLDPLVDKIFVLTVIGAMCLAGYVPFLAFMLLFIRDLCMILVGCYYYFNGGQNVQANLLGKSTTVFNYILIGMLFFDSLYPFNYYFLWFVITFSAFTAVRYGFEVVRMNSSRKVV